MGYDLKDLSKVKLVKWGIDNEDKVRDYYVMIKFKEYDGFVCRYLGFFIDENRLYIGVFVDGIVICNCCKLRVLEIKCFYKYKDVDFMEVVMIDFKFCLDKDGNFKIIY